MIFRGWGSGPPVPPSGSAHANNRFGLRILSSFTLDADNLKAIHRESQYIFSDWLIRRHVGANMETWAPRIYCKFGNFRENFIFANKRHIYHVKNRD